MPHPPHGYDERAERREMFAEHVAEHAPWFRVDQPTMDRLADTWFAFGGVRMELADMRPALERVIEDASFAFRALDELSQSIPHDVYDATPALIDDWQFLYSLTDGPAGMELLELSERLANVDPPLGQDTPDCVAELEETLTAEPAPAPEPVATPFGWAHEVTPVAELALQAENLDVIDAMAVSAGADYLAYAAHLEAAADQAASPMAMRAAASAMRNFPTLNEAVDRAPRSARIPSSAPAPAPRMAKRLSR